MFGNPTPRSLIFTPLQVEQMLHHILSKAPEEACGLIAGQKNKAALIIPITNELHSPYRYRMSPEEQLAAFTLIDDAGLDLLAIYHSHPSGPEIPSVTDVAEAYYPDAQMVIWANSIAGWNFRCFSIQNGVIIEHQSDIQSD